MSWWLTGFGDGALCPSVDAVSGEGDGTPPAVMAAIWSRMAFPAWSSAEFTAPVGLGEGLGDWVPAAAGVLAPGAGTPAPGLAPGTAAPVAAPGCG